MLLVSLDTLQEIQTVIVFEIAMKTITYVIGIMEIHNVVKLRFSLILSVTDTFSQVDGH